MNIIVISASTSTGWSPNGDSYGDLATISPAIISNNLEFHHKISPYGDLAIISPTIVSNKTMSFKQIYHDNN